MIVVFLMTQFFFDDKHFFPATLPESGEKDTAGQQHPSGQHNPAPVEAKSEKLDAEKTEQRRNRRENDRDDKHEFRVAGPFDRGGKNDTKSVKRQIKRDESKQVFRNRFRLLKGGHIRTGSEPRKQKVRKEQKNHAEKRNVKRADGDRRVDRTFRQVGPIVAELVADHCGNGNSRSDNRQKSERIQRKRHRRGVISNISQSANEKNKQGKTEGVKENMNAAPQAVVHHPFG